MNDSLISTPDVGPNHYLKMDRTSYGVAVRRVFIRRQIPTFKMVAHGTTLAAAEAAVRLLK